MSGNTLTSIVWPPVGLTPSELAAMGRIELAFSRRLVRTHPPRLILILGAKSAKDQIKVRDLNDLDDAFADARTRLAIKAIEEQQP